MSERNSNLVTAYTPSSVEGGWSRWIYPLAALLSLCGLADSIYLTVKHVTGESVRCTISSGCDAVLGSPYAIIGGLPLAALGALAYFTAFSLATLASFGYSAARGLLLILGCLMTMMTLRLLYIQAFVLREYCEFCLLSAAITLILTGLAIIGYWGARASRPQ